MKKKISSMVGSFILGLALLAGTSCGSTEEKPQGIGFHSMDYDGESEMLIIYGGQVQDYDFTTQTTMTWAYDCGKKQWARMRPPVHPEKTAFHTMAYDSESDRMVLFNGKTWTYDYNSNLWEERKPNIEPRQVFGADMTYDAESDRIILFGGTVESETWAYDENSNQWERKTPSKSPEKRLYPALAYDPDHDRVVLFGGGRGVDELDVYRQTFDDTWTYDYNTDSWEKARSLHAPTKRVYHDMVYCPDLERTLLYGGFSYDKEQVVRPHLWAYDCGNDVWEQLKLRDVVLEPVRKHKMVFLEESCSLIIAGGLSADPITHGAPRFSNKVAALDLSQLR
jgi:N-acetylneuraminic acid mutarotase